jgi:hypothetical protein
LPSCGQVRDGLFEAQTGLIGALWTYPQKLIGGLKFQKFGQILQNLALFVTAKFENLTRVIQLTEIVQFLEGNLLIIE